MTDELKEVAQDLARVAETMRRFARLPPETSVADQPAAPGQDGQADLSTAEMLARAKRLIRQRRRRNEVFSAYPQLFGEPAFDILLDLYVAAVEKGCVSVTSACIAAAVPPTTALRWLVNLKDLGLLYRFPDDLDRRRSFVALTIEGHAMMDQFLRHAG